MFKTFLFQHFFSTFGNKKQKANINTKIHTYIKCIALLLVSSAMFLAGSSVHAQSETYMELLIGKTATPEITNIAPGDLLQEARPVIYGLSASGTFIDIYIDGGLDSTIVVERGQSSRVSFSGQLNIALEPGQHTLFAIARSVDKVKSEPTEDIVFAYKTADEPPAVAEGKEGSAPKPQIAGAPKPTLRSIKPFSAVMGSKPILEGVGSEDVSLIFWVDGEPDGSIVLGQHPSGAVGFLYEINSSLEPGWHSVFAFSYDSKGNKSEPSFQLDFFIEYPFIAPTILEAVHTDTSNYVAGLAANDSRVKVFVDGNEDGEFFVTPHASGVTHFVYDIKQALSPGSHEIKAQAFDPKSKPSKVSGPVTLKIPAPSAAPATPPIAPETPSIDETAEPQQDGKGKVLSQDEQAVITDENDIAEDEGRIFADDEDTNGGPVQIAEGGEEEFGIGGTLDEEDSGVQDEDIFIEGDQGPAIDGNNEEDLSSIHADKDVLVDENVPEEAESEESIVAAGGVNWPMAIGVVILIALIISFIVWYIIQRREMVNEGIQKLFGDEDDWDEEEAENDKVSEPEDHESVEKALYEENEISSKEEKGGGKKQKEEEKKKHKHGNQYKEEDDDITLPPPPPEI